MKGLADISIRTTWMAILAIFTLLVMGVGALGVYGNHSSRQSFDIFDRIHVQQSSALNRAYVDMLRARVEMSRAAQLIERPSFDRPGPVIDSAEALMASAAESFEEFRAINALPEQQEAIEALSRSFQSLFNTGLQLQLTSLRDEDVEGWRAFRSRVSEMSETFMQSADQFFVTSRAQGEALTDRSNALSRAFDIAIGGAILACLLLVGFMLWWVTRYLTRPIHGLLRRFRSMGDGDLSTPVETRGRNEIGRLFEGLGELRQSLADTVLRVRGSSDSVVAHVDRMSAGNRELAFDTDRQSSALEQTSASLEELSRTVSANADHARRASELTDDASHQAQRGGDVMQRMTANMGGIESSSRQVAEVIGMIDHIAFQTNILALNASVEAARAGQHGRGFSVVASEVRSLAERSAGAADDVRKLIESCDAQVAEGVQLVSQAEASMTHIATSIGEINVFMSDIASASGEQREGIDQVGTAMGEMAQVTTHNRERAREASDVAEWLSTEAQRLREGVASFTMAEGDRLEAPVQPALDRQGNDVFVEEDEWRDTEPSPRELAMPS
ncbi:methyl-accepting chemotaxis protein [Kushneria aurantia]|uniref:Methyl-accepting chemotaxis protein n=1 Tax=Kushneria aurantia TaxID=504092 RepID=A0ABV6G2I1_9GAMM|nr:methyl-accepting chemotaxis protein [Kushneria aurantia]